MKVIAAGMPKTGTKSLKAALIELGYKVYDYEENLLFLNNDWRRICSEGGNTEDFYQMYKNVDAVSDVPACYFWDEIHKAFPDSKIILTMRDSEETWINSYKKQIEVLTQVTMLFLAYLSPTMHALFQYNNVISTAIFGIKVKYSLFRPTRINNMLLRMKYRRHNSHVMQTAPKDKLLIYNIKDGWKPLCKFLRVKVPEKPFPMKNVGASLVKEAFKEGPLFQKCKRELIISTSLLSLMIGYVGYKFYHISTYI